jgi:hypothetical protein
MRTDFILLGTRINIASRSRRRWLVALVYAAFALLILAWCAFDLQSTWSWILFCAFAILARFLGGRSYDNGLLPAFEGGDERERYRRYRAGYIAYEWLDLAFFPALIALAVKINPHLVPANPAVHIFLDRLPIGLMIAVGILYYTLPQCILLWTEPDIEAEQ